MQHRTILYFAALLAIFSFASTSTFAQVTLPTPGTDTSRIADTTKKPSGYTLRTLHMSPVFTLPTEDNAGIDSAKQFDGGARSLPDSFYYPGEKHLRNIRQLTFEGENTETNFSSDGQYLCFEAQGIKRNKCDQIYRMSLSGNGVKRISQGYGATMRPCFLPSGDTILFASTHAEYGGGCPEPDSGHLYDWPLYGGYDLYLADTNGTPSGRVTNNPNYYDAEASVSPKGDRIIFTSTRSGDIDLFSMKLDGTDVKQLTSEAGYDGYASYSPDGSKIVYCASHPKGHSLTEYRELLKQGYFKPHTIEFYVMDANGSHKRQVTHLDALSYSPSWTPDGKHIIFSSNYLDPKGAFNLFTIGGDGKDLEQITYGGGLNGFPQFSKDGKHLLFSSNRNHSHPSDTNIFVADWTE